MLNNNSKFKIMYDEEKHIKALLEINNLNLLKRKWLLDYFILYKQSLNWPNNLPPIKRTCIINTPSIEKFNLKYESILSQFDYRLNDEEKRLELK
jgi:hypothetical protein